MTRAECLNAAMQCVTVDRQAQHGRPEQTFGAIAAMWSAYLDTRIDPHDVAVMMVLLKAARTRSNPHNSDNWVDAAGYVACGAELVRDGERQPVPDSCASCFADVFCAACGPVPSDDGKCPKCGNQLGRFEG